MLVLPVLVLLVIGVAVVATSASERPRVLPVLALGGAGLLLVLVATAVLGVGMRGEGHEAEHGVGPRAASTTVPARVERPRVEVREVDAVVRPGGRSEALDRLPDVSTRLVRIRTDEPVVVRQCVAGGSCRPGVPMRSIDGSALGLVELHRRVGTADCVADRCTLVVTRGRSARPVATVPLWFGRSAPVVPVTVPAARPVGPVLRPDLPGGRLAAGLAGAAVLLALAAWLLRRRPDERVEDPFWDVALDVPEWEGVSLDVDDDELFRTWSR